MNRIFLLMGLLLAPLLAKAEILQFTHPRYVVKTDNHRLEITTDIRDFHCELTGMSNGKDKAKRPYIGYFFFCDNSPLSVDVKYYTDADQVDLIFLDTKNHDTLQIDKYVGKEIKTIPSFD